jgi:2-polyprenyl-3-methyl-5-hydroxy-6-metoxy-1,4-benzoquinol methylase
MQDKYIGKWHIPWDDSLQAQVGREKDTNLDAIIANITGRLELTKDDVILDVCCGNGMLTKSIATRCKSICGVDFSEILINTANQKSRVENITYYLFDALDICNIFPANYFDKSNCAGALQHFNYNTGKQVIKNISQVTRPSGRIFICDIPDKTRRSKFYNTFRKRLGFLKNRASRMLKKMDGEDRLGWWWHPDQVKRACSELGLKCKILEQNEDLPYHHYRFDALIINTK